MGFVCPASKSCPCSSEFSGRHENRVIKVPENGDHAFAGPCRRIDHGDVIEAGMVAVTQVTDGYALLTPDGRAGEAGWKVELATTIRVKVTEAPPGVDVFCNTTNSLLLNWHCRSQQPNRAGLELPVRSPLAMETAFA